MSHKYIFNLSDLRDLIPEIIISAYEICKFIIVIIRRYPEKDNVIVCSISNNGRHIDGPVWHLDVGSSHPPAEAGGKGLAVRQLKRYVSWVQYVVRQYGLYLPWVLET